MSGRFCSLSSGSSGNAVYLEAGNTRLLFDIGISFKRLGLSLDQIGVDVSDIDGVVISHEHTDHISGLSMVCKKLGIPVFCNSDTAKAICKTMEVRPKFKIFSTGENFAFGDVQISPFSIQHDTVDPVAFAVSIGELKVGICTDLGFVTKLTEVHLSGCDYLYIEANHDEELVYASSRPMIYKQRVLSRQGHLSNKACAKLLSTIYNKNLKHVFLAHLSKECNCPDLAIKTIGTALLDEDKKVDISVAEQKSISKIIKF